MIQFLCHVFFLLSCVILYIFGRDIVRLCDLSYHLCWCCEAFCCKYIHSKIFVHLLFYFLYWYLLWLYVFIVGPFRFFVYYYSSNGNLPIKHRKSDLAKNYDVIDEISDYHKHFLSISAISISVYSVCLCMYNYYVHVHTHKIDSTSPVNQKLGTLFFFIV